jgi:hypothetical protein
VSTLAIPLEKQIARLFGTGIPAISKHIKNIVNQEELDALATISKMETVQQDGLINLHSFDLM